MKVKNRIITYNKIGMMMKDIRETYQEKAKTMEPTQALQTTINSVMEKYDPESEVFEMLGVFVGDELTGAEIVSDCLVGSISAEFTDTGLKVYFEPNEELVENNTCIIGEVGQIISNGTLTYELKENDPEGVLMAKILGQFERYIKGDWGKLGASDCEMNDNAVKYENDRILARYEIPGAEDDIYIITESDRSYTTILYCGDY